MSTEDPVEQLNLSDIIECIQMRVEMSKETIADYQDQLRKKAGMPPVKGVRNEAGIWIYDGNHTIEAARRNGQKTVQAVFKEGGRQDAVLLAAGANHDHGLRRTHEDLRNTLKLLLAVKEWANRSDNWLAKSIGCSNHFVAKWRPKLSTWNVPSERETADGRMMNTTNIGGASTSEESEEPNPATFHQDRDDPVERAAVDDYEADADDDHDIDPEAIETLHSFGIDVAQWFLSNITSLRSVQHDPVLHPAIDSFVEAHTRLFSAVGDIVAKIPKCGTCGWLRPEQVDGRGRCKECKTEVEYDAE